MDIPRKTSARKRLIQRIVFGTLAIALILLTTAGLSRLKPAPPSVDRGTVMIDKVRRGALDRQVRGLGKLTPEDIRWIPALTDGRVERRLVLPGTPVKADTVILEMSNPDLQLAALDAESQMKAAESDLENLRVKVQTDRLDKEANAAQVASDYAQARAQSETDEALAKEGLIPELNLKVSRAKASGLEVRDNIEKKRLAIEPEAARAQIAAQQTKVDQLRAAYNLKKSQVEALKVRPGVDGVLQLLVVDVGQRVTAGTNLARVADPHKLKAELQIAETQAKDVAIGQSAEIDTRNGIIPGKVIRKDPSVQNNTVTVDVSLTGALPEGAVPDLTVDGTIELEHLADVIFVGRPAFGQEKSTITLFKLEPDGKTAVRIPVKLGRSSVSNVEILDGLKPGDEVILSDMTRWDGVDRVRLQ